MTKKELESLRELAQKIDKKRKEYEYQKLFERVLQSLNKLPVVKKGEDYNPYFLKSWRWEKGLMVMYENEKATWNCLHEYNDVASQLFRLFIENKINYETKIKFIFRDYKEVWYDYTKEMTLQLKTILPYIIRDLKERGAYETELEKLEQKIMKEFNEFEVAEKVN